MEVPAFNCIRQDFDCKTFGVSNLIYSLSILESSDDVLKKAQNALNNFIWGGQLARVKHKTLIDPYNLGGLCAPYVQSQNKTKTSMDWTTSKTILGV